MENIENITKYDLENLGRNYLIKGLRYTVERNFAKGSLCFQEAIDIITCDCNSKDWMKKAGVNLKNLLEKQDVFSDINFKGSNPEDYLFCKAFVLSYPNLKKYNYLGLNAIEQYLKIKENHYGYYVLGKLQNYLGLFKESLTSYEKAFSINPTHSLKYKIGRLKEQELNEIGIRELYTAFTNNPSSGCAIRILKKYANERGINIESREEKGRLTIAFNEDEDEYSFTDKYLNFIRKESNLRFDSLMNSSNNIVSELFQAFDTNSTSFINFKYNEERKNGNHISHYDDSYNNGFNDEFYNDQLDMDQQSPEFWDSL